MPRFFVLVALTAALGTAGCDLLQVPEPDPVELSLEGVEIIDTQSRDSLISSGETVQVDLFVKNMSLSAVDSVDFEIASTDAIEYAYARWVIGGTTYDYPSAPLRSGETARVSVFFEVATDKPVGTVIPLNVKVTGKGGRSGTVSTEFRTVPLPYALEVIRTEVVADGDHDGRIEAGEQSTLKAVIDSHYDESRPGDMCFRGEVTSVLPQVVLVGHESNICLQYSSHDIYVTIRPSATLSAGTAMPFNTRLTDPFGNTLSLPFQIQLQ